MVYTTKKTFYIGRVFKIGTVVIWHRHRVAILLLLLNLVVEALRRGNVVSRTLMHRFGIPSWFLSQRSAISQKSVNFIIIVILALVRVTSTAHACILIYFDTMTPIVRPLVYVMI